MHKSVMALLFGIAIDDGFIPSVDEPASTYLTEWQNDERSKITIRNMLQMAHGLSRAPGGFSPLSDNMKLSLGTDWGGIALKAPAEDPPGTVFAYSNLNSPVAGVDPPARHRNTLCRISRNTPMVACGRKQRVGVAGSSRRFSENVRLTIHTRAQLVTNGPASPQQWQSR